MLTEADDSHTRIADNSLKRMVGCFLNSVKALHFLGVNVGFLLNYNR